MKIAFDLDDVLVDTIGHYIEVHNRTYPNKVCLADFTTHQWVANSGENSREGMSWPEFYEQEGLNIPFVKGAIRGIRILAGSNELISVTSRSQEYSEGTEQLVRGYFGNDICKVLYANKKFGESSRKKSEICVEGRVDVIVEDRLSHAEDCAKVCERVYLFGDYPWNQNGSLPGNVERVGGWSELLVKLGC